MKVDYNALAHHAGYSNAHCAGVMWSGIRKRLIQARATAGNGDAAKSGDETSGNGNGAESEAVAASVTPKKRARKPKDPNATPSKRAKKGAKPAPEIYEDEQVDDEEPNGHENYIGDTRIKSEPIKDEEDDMVIGSVEEA